MFKIFYAGHAGIVGYRSEALAWRAIHEELEEAFGDRYDDADLAAYAVIKV